MAKSALETKIKDIERDLKKETHEANQISAKLEQDLSKEKEIAQKHQQSLKNEIDSLKVEISEKSANFEVEKTGLETKLKEVEYNLKKDAEEAKENCSKLEHDLLRKTESFDQLMESLDDEKNKLKTISLEKDSLMEELTKIKEENKNQSEVQSISTELENMMKEKDSDICQLNMKIEDLETKLASSEMAKSALETLSNDIENDLKKETHEASKLLDEANQINAKLEQDLANEKEINQKLQQEVIDGLANFENAKTALETKLMKEAEDAKEISAKFEQDLVKKSESFDQLMESLENEKNKLKIISLEKDGLLEELKEYKNQSQVQNITTEMENMMKEKDSEICQLNLEIGDLETKLDQSQADNNQLAQNADQQLKSIKSKANSLEIQCQNNENIIEEYKVNALLLQSKLSSHELSFDQLTKSLDDEKNKLKLITLDNHALMKELTTIKEENKNHTQVQKIQMENMREGKDLEICQLNLKIKDMEMKLAHNVESEAKTEKDFDFIKQKATGLEIQCQNYENAIEEYKVNVLLLQSKLSSHESSFEQLITSLDHEKNKLKIISLEKDCLMDELTKMKEENKNQSKIQNITTQMEEKLKEKDSDIIQLNLKIRDLETKLARNLENEAKTAEDLDLLKTKNNGFEIQCQNYENAIEEYKVNVLLLQSKLSSHESSFEQLMKSLDEEKNKLKTITMEKDSLMEELTKIKEESDDDEKNQLKIISLEKEILLEELNEMKEKNMNQSESEIKKEMVNMVYGNMLKEKDSDIFQLNLKIEGLESKLARNAKVNQNYENTIEEYKVNVLLLQSKLSSHESSFDQLMESLAIEKNNLKMISSEKESLVEQLAKIQNENDQRSEVQKQKDICQYESTQMQSMMKEKDLDICQLNLKNETLETKLAQVINFIFS